MAKVLSLPRSKPKAKATRRDAVAAADWVELHIRFKRREDEYICACARELGESKSAFVRRVLRDRLVADAAKRRP
jgi:hypothetical protein